MLRKRRSVIFILAALALLAGLATGREILFTLTYLLALLLLISFFWAWANINWLHISRVTRTRRTQVGRPLEERFMVRNTSAVPKLWLSVEDHSTLPAHQPSQVVTGLSARGSYVWRVNTICTRRGRYQLGPISLHTSDPFGLFPMQRDLSPTTHVVVYPQTVDVHQFTLPAGILPGGDALRRRTHQVTTNASGVREYAPGDSFNRIHWRSTARRGRLIVKEFELDPLADIWIIPDMWAGAHITSAAEAAREYALANQLPWRAPKEFKLAETTEEYTVTIAASLAQYFLRRDRAVGMLTYAQSHEFIQPDRGERQLNRILETLAVVRADGQLSLPDMLYAETNVLPRGTTVIAVTPTTDVRWASSARDLMRRGSRVVTVIVDPASFGGTESGDTMAGLLRMNNVPTYVAHNGDNLTAVLSQRMV